MPVEMAYNGIDSFEGFVRGWIKDQRRSNVRTTCENDGGSISSPFSEYSGGGKLSKRVDEVVGVWSRT